jgi:hypothetical protein
MRIWMAGLALLLGGVGSLRAQTAQSSYSVTVTVAWPPSGYPIVGIGPIISGAEVSLSSVGAATVTSMTDRSGEAHFSMPAGDYEIAVTAHGFLDAVKNFALRGSSDSHVYMLLKYIPTDRGCTIACPGQQEPMPLIAGTPLVTLIEPMPELEDVILQSRPFPKKTKQSR